MAIEKNIQDIKKAHLRTGKTLKVISNWQKHHEKDDLANFTAIKESIALLPTVEIITEAVQDAVQTKVNGKIDKISEHLTEQDVNMGILAKKIKPFDGAKAWANETVKVILYLGGLAVAIIAIVEALKMFGFIK